jgi:hypothetical protein
VEGVVEIWEEQEEHQQRVGLLVAVEGLRQVDL